MTDKQQAVNEVKQLLERRRELNAIIVASSIISDELFIYSHNNKGIDSLWKVCYDEKTYKRTTLKTILVYAESLLELVDRVEELMIKALTDDIEVANKVDVVTSESTSRISYAEMQEIYRDAIGYNEPAPKKGELVEPNFKAMQVREKISCEYLEIRKIMMAEFEKRIKNHNLWTKIANGMIKYLAMIDGVQVYYNMSISDFYNILKNCENINAFTRIMYKLKFVVDNSKKEKSSIKIMTSDDFKQLKTDMVELAEYFVEDDIEYFETLEKNAEYLDYGLHYVYMV